MNAKEKDKTLRLSWKPRFDIDVECDDEQELYTKAARIIARLNERTPYQWESAGGCVSSNYLRTWYSLVIRTRDLTLLEFDNALAEVNQIAQETPDAAKAR